MAVLARTSVGFTYDREPMMFCDPCGRLFKVPPMTLGELVRRWIVRKLLMWRLDNDTLREVPHRSNEGLALQARVSGPWPPKKRICLTGEACSLARCASTNCCGQSVVHRDELNVQGRKK